MALPGGELSTRPLHFIWICDCSGSMSVNGKIESLNEAIKQAIPLMQKAADENVYAQVLIRAIKFSTGAQWHIAQPTPVEKFKWTDLTADGVTDMGKALSMVAEQLRVPPMTDRALPPVLVLISDGQPTDNFSSGLKQLMEQPWGKKAVRVAIAIGRDAESETLQKFIGNSELKILESNNPDQLVERIKWVSTVVLKIATSAPSSPYQDLRIANVPIPVVPDPVVSSVGDVW